MQRFSRKSRKSKAGQAWLAYPIVILLWIGIATVHKHNLPRNLEDICTIFDERRDWYSAAKRSEARWGTPSHIQMAIIRQESSFKFGAKPPRTKLLGLVPWKRQSTAFGFAQALDSTWAQYKTDTRQPDADRDDFDDAIDFVGWYTDRSSSSVGISKGDSYNQYLAYHEGQTGWKRRTYEKKAWLVETAKGVDARARKWSGQLQRCEDELNDRWWMIGS